jgi:hypothetical protein
MTHYVWVDFDGTLSQVDPVLRHSQQGGSRGYSLARGPSSYRMWGSYTGPTPGFEISHDASKIAVVVNRTTASMNYSNPSPFSTARQDIVAFEGGGAPLWSSVTPHQVTGTESAANPIFGGSAYWRFGALTFTADNAGLCFWGGFASVNPTSGQASVHYSGSMYMWARRPS